MQDLERTKRGSSSVDRALPCQGKGRGFESRLPLQVCESIGSSHSTLELEKPNLDLFFSYMNFVSEMENAKEKIWDGFVSAENVIFRQFS
jgi:hypothetical protein